jgi:hypothetical protein
MRTISGLLAIFFLVTLFGQGSGLAQAEPGALLETEHFIFKALPDAPSDLVPDPEQIQKIGLFYESVIQDLEEGFGGQVRDKITVVYGGTAAMGTGDRTVVQPYSSEEPSFTFGCHEMLHIALKDILGPGPDLFTRNLSQAVPYNLGLEELTVTALELHFLKSSPEMHLYARVYQELTDWPSIQTILNPSSSLIGLEIEYPLVSFLAFLLDHYPWADYRLLWNYNTNFQLSQSENVDLALSQAYNESLSALEEKWKGFLKAIPVSPEWWETIKRQHEIETLSGHLANLFSEQVETIKLDRRSMKEFSQAYEELYTPDTGLSTAPYGILKEPLKNFQSLDPRLERYKAMVKVAQEAISACDKGQKQLRAKDWNNAWTSFKTLRNDLVQLGDTSMLAWVDKQLTELETKVPPEQRQAQASAAFPWWGWALIGCGVAGVLGLGGWLFICKKRAHQKGKGQQP